MKLTYSLLGILLTLSPLSFAAIEETTCNMPKAEVLRKQLRGYEHFMEKTKIVDQVADKECSPLGIAMVLELAIYDYIQNLKKGGMPENMLEMMEVQMQMSKDHIIAALLANCPNGLKELKERGLYKAEKS